jgi:hypothetical protein
MAAGDPRIETTVRDARPQTTNATPTVVTALTLASVPNLSLVRVSVVGCVVRTDVNESGVDVRAFVELHVLARRYDADATSPGLAVLKSSATPLTGDIGAIAIAVIVSSNDLQVQITGEGSKTMRWDLSARYVVTEETVDLSTA